MKIDDRLLQKVATYKPNPDAIRSISDVPIVFMVGIAGAGKDSTQNELLRRYAEEFRFIVSHTTRPMRTNNGVPEQDGVEYHFIDLSTAEAMLDNGEYVEANIVYYEDIYGTAISEIRAIKEAEKIAIGDIEVKGIEQYVDLGMNVKPIFIIPPSFDVWWQRFQGRYKGKIDWYDVLKRMRTALEEFEDVQKHDYYYVVINEDLNKTVDTVYGIATGVVRQQIAPETTMILKQLADDMAKNLKLWQAQHSGL